MKLNDILFEKELSDLAKEFDHAKQELKKDTNIRITLDEVKQFVRKWKNFTDKFDITKKRISIIKKTGDKLLKYLNYRIDKMEEVKTIDKSEIEPLRNYLDELKIDIESHIDIQQIKYDSTARRT